MIVGFACFLALLVAWVVTRLMMALAIADVPDAARKLHCAPTPTAGGVGIMAGTLIGYTYLSWHFAFVVSEAWTCLGLALAGGALGFWDDRSALGPKIKLLIMITITSVFVMGGMRIESVLVWPDIDLELGPLVGCLGTMLWLLVMVNVVNFMDGANGLSIGSSAVGLACLSGLCWAEGTLGLSRPYSIEYVGPYIQICALACCGFLYWNVNGGRIFAGDAGALFVGLAIGALGVWAAIWEVNPISVATCFLPLLADSILTIIWRARQKANLLQPHADHVYQLAIRTGRPHLLVAALYWLATGLCGAVALLATTGGTRWITLGFGLCLLCLVVILERVRACYLAIMSKQAGQ
jgi:UDP-N-acetylmuramyl pentapeptide phosphotransferase/UDP-N-acetylglucosamine-1-phosphate transferase